MLQSKIDAVQRGLNSLVGGKELLKYLKDAGFFTAPASANHHGNYEGGLYDHSHTVMETLTELTMRNGLKWTRDESPYLVGIFHDLCKIDQYEIIGKDPVSGNVKYDCVYENMKKGHGARSVMLLSQFITISVEEFACIQFHMGAFTDKNEWRSYVDAVREFPNVLWTHHADMIASQCKGV